MIAGLDWLLILDLQSYTPVSLNNIPVSQNNTQGSMLAVSSQLSLTVLLFSFRFARFRVVQFRSTT